MTTNMSTGYSLLDDAWPSQAMPLPSKPRRKKRTRQVIPPICETSVSKRSDNGYIEDFSGSLAPFDPIYINDDDARDVTRKVERRQRIAEEEEVVSPPPVVKCPPPVIKYIEVPKIVTKPSDDRYDTFLFVFSGVLLLFLMEQFLQIGIQIGIRQSRLI